jgi:hypothetical protein
VFAMRARKSGLQTYSDDKLKPTYATTRPK